jgi:hypothetical protein
MEEGQRSGIQAESLDFVEGGLNPKNNSVKRG